MSWCEHRQALARRTRHAELLRVVAGVCLCGALTDATRANADAAKPASAAIVKPTAVDGAKPAVAPAKSAAPTKVLAKTRTKTPVSKPKPSKKKSRATAQASQAPAPTVAPPEPAQPLPVASVSNRPQPAAASKVEVPSTSHVHIEVPAGLQTWLNADDRMRPWLAKAIAATDACYADERASQPALGGRIAFRLTMHENARPSAAPSSVPVGLQGMVLCVTARLIGVKMPLFTGKEGDTYTVRVQFQP
jgi:hypothetical protein